jgi:V/A-type H+-transporting ATPase subunit C
MNTLLILLAGGGLAFLVWFGRWVGKTMAYAFCNATVSAKESKIISGARLAELADAPEFKAILPDLEERGLGVRTAADGGIDWMETEKTIHESLCREFSEILEIVPGEARPVVRRLVGYREMINLKIIVTGLHEGAPKDEIISRLVPCPTETQQRFELLASAQSVEGLLEFLKGSEYHGVLAGSMEGYRKWGLKVIISAIERFYYSELWKTARKSRNLRDVLGFWIDSVNLVIAMRLKKSGLQPSEIEGYLILPGYELTREMIRAFILEEDLKSSIHSIRITSVGSVLQDHVSELERGELEEVERLLKGALLARCSLAAIKNFFSVCPVVSYILHREAEVENLRSILRMKAAGLPSENIKKILVGG